MKEQQETKKPTLEEAQAWANKRASAGETATILECPCCQSLLALYLGSGYAEPAAPDTTPASPELPS